MSIIKYRGLSCLKIHFTIQVARKKNPDITEKEYNKIIGNKEPEEIIGTKEPAEILVEKEPEEILVEKESDEILVEKQPEIEYKGVLYEKEKFTLKFARFITPKLTEKEYNKIKKAD